MAASSQAVPSSEITHRDADKPIAVGRNALQLVSAIANLVTNTDGRITQPDASATNRDRKYLIDRRRSTYWQGNAAATAWYVIADLGTGSRPPWNSILIDHDGSLDGTTLDVYGDDSTAPPAGAGSGWTGATRIVNALAIGAGPVQVWLEPTAVEWFPRYLRFELTKGSSFTPAIRNLWAGKIIQFPVKSDYGSLPLEAFEGHAVEHEMPNGEVFTYATSPPLGSWQQQFTIAERPTGTFMLAIRDMLRNSNACAALTRPFWWIEDPTADPDAAQLVAWRGERRFDPVETKPFVTRFRLQVREQGGA